MDDTRKHADRANALHSLSQTIARGTSQILRDALRVQSSRLYQPPQGGDGREGRHFGDPLDLTLKCRFCGARMADKLSESRVYCSSHCKDRDRNALISAGRAEALGDRRCRNCGDLIARGRRADTIHCSPRCSLQAWQRSQYPLKKCACCGSLFQPRTASSRFCSKSCAARFQRAARRPGLTAARFDAIRWGSSQGKTVRAVPRAFPRSSARKQKGSDISA